MFVCESALFALKALFVASIEKQCKIAITKLHILSIISSSTHFSLPAGILMHMQSWLLSEIFFAQ